MYSHMVTNEVGEPLGIEYTHDHEDPFYDTRDDYDPDYYDDESDEPVSAEEENFMDASEYYAEAMMSHYDDDPNPYEGTYSEM